MLVVYLGLSSFHRTPTVTPYPPLPSSSHPLTLSSSHPPQPGVGNVVVEREHAAAARARQGSRAGLNSSLNCSPSLPPSFSRRSECGGGEGEWAAAASRSSTSKVTHTLCFPLLLSYSHPPISRRSECGGGEGAWAAAASRSSTSKVTHALRCASRSSSHILIPLLPGVGNVVVEREHGLPQQGYGKEGCRAGMKARSASLLLPPFSRRSECGGGEGAWAAAASRSSSHQQQNHGAQQPPLEEWRSFVHCTHMLGRELGKQDHFKGQEGLSHISPASVAHFSQNKLLSLLLEQALSDARFSQQQKWLPQDKNQSPHQEKTPQQELLQPNTEFPPSDGLHLPPALFGYSADSQLQRVLSVHGGGKEEAERVTMQAGQQKLQRVTMQGHRQLKHVTMQGHRQLQRVLSVHFSSRSLGLRLLALPRPAMLYFVYNREGLGVVVAHCLREGEFVAQVRRRV
ncbi:unnamed protein product [Closterium sp. Yama58-4]|nr:unnamed protein product [Closterium sp. Yama58-4]